MTGPNGKASNGKASNGRAPGGKAANGDAAGGGASDDEVLATTGTQARRASFGPGGGAGMPVQRSAAFGPTVRRLGRLLAGEKLRLAVVVVLAVGGVLGVVIGPRILGQATDIVIDGAFGDGVDTAAVATKLLQATAVYLLAWVFAATQGWMLAGVVQRAMYALRAQVEHKINRLPLAEVDRMSRGDC